MGVFVNFYFLTYKKVRRHIQIIYEEDFLQLIYEINFLLDIQESEGELVRFFIKIKVCCT